MYLSEIGKNRRETTEEDCLGTVSVGGGNPTIVSAGSQRDTVLFGPGGMCWVPRRGQSVLVIKSGGAGSEVCIAGAEVTDTEDMEPGEVKLFAEGASVCLKNDGTIALTGRVLVNGKELTV